MVQQLFMKELLMEHLLADDQKQAQWINTGDRVEQNGKCVTEDKVDDSKQ